MVQEWRAAVTFPRPEQAPQRALSALARALPGFGVVAVDGVGLRADLTVPASALRPAVDAALEAASSAYRQAFGGAADPLAVRVVTVEDSERVVEGSAVPPLAGVAEAAEIVGVSKARIGQLTTSDSGCPEPLQYLKSGPVWLLADIEAYAASRNTQPGRRRKAAE